MKQSVGGRLKVTLMDHSSSPQQTDLITFLRRLIKHESVGDIFQNFSESTVKLEDLTGPEFGSISADEKEGTKVVYLCHKRPLSCHIVCRRPIEHIKRVL